MKYYPSVSRCLCNRSEIYRNQSRYVSVNSKPDHPPRAIPGDSHNLVAPGVGFSILCLAWGSARGGGGVLNQSKSSITFLKSAIFALSLKQMGGSSFHMFIYAGREQCDLGPIYTITNTQISKFIQVN